MARFYKLWINKRRRLFGIILQFFGKIIYIQLPVIYNYFIYGMNI
jgi:hypothetical protein